MSVGMLVTALAGISVYCGINNILGLVLLPGGLLGWALVYGDSKRPDEVMPTVIFISLVINAFAGLLIGATTGWIIRLLTRRTI